MVGQSTTGNPESYQAPSAIENAGNGSAANPVTRSELDGLRAEMESRLIEERSSRKVKESELEAKQASTDALLQAYITRYDKLLVQLQDAHALNAGVILDNKLLRSEMAEMEKEKDTMKAALNGLGSKYKISHDHVRNLHHKLEETEKMLAQAQATIDGLPGASTYGNTDKTAAHTASPAAPHPVVPVNVQHEIYKFDPNAGRFYLMAAEPVPSTTYSSYAVLADHARQACYPNFGSDRRAASRTFTLVEQLPRRRAGQVRLEKPTRRGYVGWLAKAQEVNAQYGTVGVACTYVFETKDKAVAVPVINSQVDR